MRTILIVCHANTARSVMAQALLERMLGERQARDGIQIRSAGIASYARDGMLVSLDARLALREAGIELGEDGPGSRALRHHPELVAQADLIITMTGEQKRALHRGFPETEGRPVFTLKELGGEDGDVADPAGQGEERFRACRDEITRCLERSMDRLLALLGT